MFLPRGRSRNNEQGKGIILYMLILWKKKIFSFTYILINCLGLGDTILVRFVKSLIIARCVKIINNCNVIKGILEM